MNYFDKLMFLSSIKNNVDDGRTISKKIKVDTELVGGNYWTLKAYSTYPRYNLVGFNLNGFGYTCSGNTNRVEQYNDSSNSWITKSNDGSSYWAWSGFSLNGFGYVSHGYNGSFVTNRLIAFNDGSNVWVNKSSGGTARTVSTGFSLNGFGYNCNGFNGSVEVNEVNQYNDSSNTWITKANGGTARYGLTGFSLNGFGYISNGYSTGMDYTETNQYNDSSNTWTTKSSMNTARNSLTSFNLNGFGYSCNGQYLTSNNFYDTNIVDEYNDISDSWSKKSNSGTTRKFLAGFSLNGFGYICNGNTEDYGILSSEVNQYRNTNMYYVGRLKSSNKVPKKILVATNINGYSKTLPIWIKTDSTPISGWKYMESNTDSLVKSGNTLSSTISANVSGWYNYELSVGIPTTHSTSGYAISGGLGGGYWTTKATGGTAREQLSGFSLNGYGYICNGYSDSYLNEVNQYNDSNNTWIIKSNGGTARQTLTGFSLNGFGYICNGGDNNGVSNEVNQYNDSNNIWTTKSNGGTARYGLTGFSLNGFGYICNGFDANAESNEVNQYNDSNNTWIIKSNGGTARYYLTGFNLNGFGYIIYGLNSNELNEYNDSSNIWSIKSPSVNIYGLIGFNLNEVGYICSGYSEISFLYLNEVNVYDSELDILINKANSGSPRYLLSGFGLNDLGYICNGNDGGVSNEVNQYKPNINIESLTVILRVEE